MITDDYTYANMLYNKGDKLKAAKYYKIAADSRKTYGLPNKPFAMFNYAEMLYYGDGIPVNKEEADIYYDKTIKDVERVVKKETYYVCSNMNKAIINYDKINCEEENMSIKRKSAIEYIKMLGKKKI